MDFAFVDGPGSEWKDAAELVERDAISLERFVFVSAYEMRKLADGDHLTQEVTESKWPVQEFSCTRTPPHAHWLVIWEGEDRRHRQQLEVYYDLESPRRAKLDFELICHLLIHHYAFEARHIEDEDRVAFYFNSVNRKARALYSIDLAVYMRMVQEVSWDEVRVVDHDRSRVGDEVRQWRSHPDGWMA
jgi:hypothetical protein